jgi:hypothetical protein
VNAALVTAEAAPLTRRQRALLVAEQAMVHLHGEPMFWRPQDLADRRALIARIDAELAVMDLAGGAR